MARDFAAVNLAIWQDSDFRRLPVEAQHLYLVLWSDPALTYCGVTDWRPGRIAARASGWTADAVEAAAACLEARHFLVVDRDTEEVLIRSWIRFDGLMKQPVMAVSMAKAYATVASSEIRGVITHEMVRLHSALPDLAGWNKVQVAAILSAQGVDPKQRDTPPDPFDNPPLNPPSYPSADPPINPTANPPVRGKPNPSANPSPYPPSTPSPSPSPLKDGPRKRGTRLPEGWAPNPELRAEMIAENPGVDLRREHAKFVDYWAAKAGKDATKVDWDATWRNWIRRAADSQPRQLQPTSQPWTPEPPPPEIADDPEACDRWYRDQAERRRAS